MRGLGTARGSAYRNPRELSNKANFSTGVGRNRNYYSNDKPRGRGYSPRITPNGYMG